MCSRRKYTEVKCKECSSSFKKRFDSIKSWGGRCKVCASKELARRPEIKEMMIKNGMSFIKKYGEVPNAKKFKVGEMSGDNSPTWKGGRPKCKMCGVGLINYKASRCVKCNGESKKGIQRSKQIIDKCRKNIPRGVNHHNWKGGISGESVLIRMSYQYNDWRKSVFERDNYTCQHCGDRSREGYSVELNADHIKPFSLYPELRLDINNGRTLCKSCHIKTDTFGIKLLNKINARKVIANN